VGWNVVGRRRRFGGGSGDEGACGKMKKTRGCIGDRGRKIGENAVWSRLGID